MGKKTNVLNGPTMFKLCQLINDFDETPFESWEEAESHFSRKLHCKVTRANINHAVKSVDKDRSLIFSLKKTPLSIVFERLSKLESDVLTIMDILSTTNNNGRDDNG